MADLNVYDVEVRGMTTQMKLSDEDAEFYGDKAKKVGPAKKIEAQPVGKPPYATDESTQHPEGDKPDDKEEKAAPAPANKRRTAANKSSN